MRRAAGEGATGELDGGAGVGSSERVPSPGAAQSTGSRGGGRVLVLEQYEWRVYTEWLRARGEEDGSKADERGSSGSGYRYAGG